MKKLAPLLIAFVILGGCATAQPTMQTRYVLGMDGNIQQEQYLVAAPEDNTLKIAQTLGIITLGFLGMYFIMDAAGVWDDDVAPAATAAPANPLVPSSGLQWQASGFDSEFIAPVYQTVN